MSLRFSCFFFTQKKNTILKINNNFVIFLDWSEHSALIVFLLLRLICFGLYKNWLNGLILRVATSEFFLKNVCVLRVRGT